MTLTKENWIAKAADIFQERKDLDRDSAEDAADAVLSDFLTIEGIEFGDPSQDWNDPTGLVEDELAYWD